MTKLPECKQKPMSIGQLASYYNVSKRTMRKWLVPFRAEIGSPEGNFYTPRQISIIFDKLGD